jgi:hypothetical protein
MGSPREFGADVLSGLIAGVTAVALVSAVTFWPRDRLHDWVVSQDPTCQEPGSLAPLSGDDLKADGVSDAEDQQPSDAVDGYAGSWWVPELGNPRANVEDKNTWHVAQLQRDPGTRTLVLSLGGKRDVRLVCVINGLAESRTRYLMHGSVSSVTVWGDDSSGSVQTSLERLPTEQMQTFQDAGRDIGRTRSLHIRVDAVASGETVLSNDPNDCFPVARGFAMGQLEDGETPQRVYAEGCIRAPAPYAGLAEVVVYIAS